MTPRTYITERGHALCWMRDPLDVPVLTIECYEKWYCLHTVLPGGVICTVSFGELDTLANRYDLTPYADHVPNPKVVQRLASDRGWELDPNALEMIIGRWEIEACDRYGEDG